MERVYFIDVDRVTFQQECNQLIFKKERLRTSQPMSAKELKLYFGSVGLLSCIIFIFLLSIGAFIYLSIFTDPVYIVGIVGMIFIYPSFSLRLWIELKQRELEVIQERSQEVLADSKKTVEESNAAVLVRAERWRRDHLKEEIFQQAAEEDILIQAKLLYAYLLLESKEYN